MFWLEGDERGLRSLKNFLEHLGLELAYEGLDLQRYWSSYSVREKREYDVEISFGGGEWREIRMSWQLDLGN